MAHYISILVPRGAGGWRALFPDVPGCKAEGDNLDITVFRATGALHECLDALGVEGKGPPAPRALSEIKADVRWVSDHRVDWTKAVVTMIPLRNPPNQSRH